MDGCLSMPSERTNVECSEWMLIDIEGSAIAGLWIEAWERFPNDAPPVGDPERDSIALAIHRRDGSIYWETGGDDNDGERCGDAATIEAAKAAADADLRERGWVLG
jgi:hypothetical protein